MPNPLHSDLDWVTDALSDRTRRAIYMWVKHQRTQVSVNEVAEAFDMHRNAVKFHLDKLLDAGLLAADFKRINGRQGPGAGRPSKLYAATDVEVSFSIPERRYELLAQLLLRALTSGDPIASVGYQFGRTLAQESIAADGEADLLESAQDILAGLGFEPSVERDPDGRVWITTENCPFGGVALEAPNQEVCQLDHAIIRGIIEAFAPGESEVKEHMSMPHGHQVCVREVCFTVKPHT